MQRSTDRILATHVGSLIRPQPLQEFLRAKQAGKPFDERAYEQCLTESVAGVVQEQAKALGAALRAHAPALRIEATAEDFVSINAMEAWNNAILDEDDSPYARMQAYLGNLHTLAQQLRVAARHYQLDEDEIAATFRDRRVP